MGNLIRLIACAALTILSAARCDSSDQSESGAMFFLKKSKPDVTSVSGAIGAPLLKQAKFSDVRPAPVQPAVMAKARFLRGVPPNATFADPHVPGSLHTKQPKENHFDCPRSEARVLARSGDMKRSTNR